MKTTRSAAKLAKELLNSAIANGQLDENKLSNVTSKIAQFKGPAPRQVLQLLLKYVEKYNSQKQLVIETAFPLEKEMVDKITDQFEKLLNKKLTPIERENKDLIGGVRIINNDNIWENSVISNLKQLKGEFINV